MSTPTAGRPARSQRFRVGAAVALAVLAGIILWLALRDTAGVPSASPSSRKVTSATVAQLDALAASVKHPVFWAGPKNGFTYELRRTSDGSIYVRYLPQGVKLGATKPYLTVATYPFPGAFNALETVAKRKGVTPIHVPHDGLAAFSARDPHSVHIAYPGVDYQIEVFDPTPGSATKLVALGQVVAFGSLKGGSAARSPGTGHSKAASLAELKAVARSLGHPVYWAGPRSGFTYELTQTTSGRVYIRYLPKGVSAGTSRQYLTVATYPFANAFGALQSVAKQTNDVAINLAGGGLALLDAHSPKSIHAAYPGAPVEVEVFDPSPARARHVVDSNEIRAIG